jgi:hypothetical protein
MAIVFVSTIRRYSYDRSVYRDYSIGQVVTDLSESDQERFVREGLAKRLDLSQDPEALVKKISGWVRPRGDYPEINLELCPLPPLDPASPAPPPSSVPVIDKRRVVYVPGKAVPKTSRLLAR